MARILESAPNPQFARENWIDLTGAWRFRYDDDNIGLQAGWSSADFGAESREIMVPYPPESELSGIGDPSFHPWVWYQRELPPATSGERTLIHFGAIDFEATVWIDGVFVGQHIGGSSPFAIDVSTEWLQTLDSRLLTVRVFDDPTDREQPRGKQGWDEEPNVIWYKRTTGIWQPVWMESVPARYLQHARWVFDASAKSLRLDVELSGTSRQQASVTATVSLPGGNDLTLEIAVQGRYGSSTVSLEGVENLDDLLWSPQSPTLLPTRITTDSGDEVLSYIGLRSLDLDKAGFRINAQPVWLAMVLSQGYFPESHYAAPSAEAIRREVELTLALGFNGARTHQKAEDPRYLYWADKLGLLIWGEIGAAQDWSDRAIELLSNEWRELVRRDINHPSIIAWVPFNESWGIGDVPSHVEQQHAVRAIYALTNALDGTRPVIGNDGWEHVATDVFSLHDYEWQGDVLTERYGSGKSNNDVASTYSVAKKVAVAASDLDVSELPLMISEYGGVSYAPAQNEEWFGYGKVTNDDEFVAKYRELTQALHDSDELVGVCYTQLTDTEQETNGLLNADRTPKIDISTLREITRGTRV